MILVITLMLALLMISLVATAPAIATQIKREREVEMMHRGQQYARAIKRYYRKFGRYPAKIEDLEKTNNLRFLRKRYDDPITGKPDWRLIHVGEAKIKPKVFGQVGQQIGQNIGQQIGSQIGQQLGAASPNGQAPANNGSAIGTPASAMSNGTVVSGGAIIGVSSSSDKESLMEMDEHKHYNEWEFTYDPRYDTSLQQNALNPNQSLNQNQNQNQNRPQFPAQLPGMQPPPKP